MSFLCVCDCHIIKIASVQKLALYIGIIGRCRDFACSILYTRLNSRQKLLPNVKQV